MTDWRLEDDCFVHDKDRLKHVEVIDLLRARLHPLATSSSVQLARAQNMIAASDVLATRPIPAADNSAVDGFAVRHADLATSGTTILPVSLTQSAGILEQNSLLGAKAAARIFTGAIMPDGADTVLMQEDCKFDSDANLVEIPAGIKLGANRRRAGEDTQIGDCLLASGQSIGPAEIARLASAGIAELPVFNPLKIAIFSTGNELLPAGDQPTMGSVFNSNGPMLEGLAKLLPVDIENHGILPDNFDMVKTALANAVDKYDVILTTGGASKGDADFLRGALLELGHCHLWQLAIKPGRPMMMGQIGQTPVFGLPGNPVAVFVCWCLYVYPSLIRLGGASWREPLSYKLPAGFEVKSKKPNRREFYRGWTESSGAATLVQKFQRDGSGLISGLQQATGLVEIPEETSKVALGDTVSFIPFSQFGIR